MIICLYLTGMRRKRPRGCPDPEPEQDGTQGRRHLIRAHHYKNVTDDDGHHVSAGAERDVPSVAITPVIHAIRILERIVPEGQLLLSAAHHDFPGSRNHPGALKGRGLALRVEAFVAWANQEAHSHGLADQTIPQDPHGAIGCARFRRILSV